MSITVPVVHLEENRDKAARIDTDMAGTCTAMIMVCWKEPREGRIDPPILTDRYEGQQPGSSREGQTS